MKHKQLESTERNLANVAENTAAARGSIMDTDYAAETANLTKAQILQQARLRSRASQRTTTIVVT